MGKNFKKDFPTLRKEMCSSTIGGDEGIWKIWKIIWLQEKWGSKPCKTMKGNGFEGEAWIWGRAHSHSNAKSIRDRTEKRGIPRRRHDRCCCIAPILREDRKQKPNSSLLVDPSLLLVVVMALFQDVEQDLNWRAVASFRVPNQILFPEPRLKTPQPEDTSLKDLRSSV